MKPVNTKVDYFLGVDRSVRTNNSG